MEIEIRCMRSPTFPIPGEMYQLLLSLLLTLAAACEGWLNLRLLAEEELVAPAKVTPLPQAFAENDYVQPRPLLGGLELGFRHIEADVFLLDDRLMVGNSILDLQTQGSLEELYLQPLMQLHRSASPRLENAGQPVMLFLDIKSEPTLSYRVLQPLLKKYSAMLTSVSDDQVFSNSVTVVLGGHVAREQLATENPRYAAIDGRLSDIDTPAPNHWMPTISLRWSAHFRWQGKSEFTSFERARLLALVARVHAQRRKLRFWSTPESELVWSVLRAAEVDLVGSKNYLALHRFFTVPPSPFTR
jgi:hypothetical protein